MRRVEAALRRRMRGGRASRWSLLIANLCVLTLAVSRPAQRRVQDTRAAVPLPSNVLVAVDRTEPSLAINPRQPLNVILAANPTYAANRLHRYPPSLFSSVDGGQTWRSTEVVLPGQYGTGADTSLAIDSAGRAYLGMVGEDYTSFCGRAAHTTAILVARSDDGGRSLRSPVVVDSNAAGASVDKPYLTVWEVPALPHRARHTMVAIVWTRSLPGRGSQIVIARSLDGARTFTRAQVIVSSAGANLLGALPAAGPDGALYVAWEAFTRRSARTPQRIQLAVARSLDGGATFHRPVALPLSWDLPTMLPAGQLRVFAMPALAVDTASGTVYVAWARARLAAPGTYAGMAADVVLSRSRDGGVTWSAPVVLNDSPTGDRFMPSLALLPGGLAAIFYDRRADGHAFDVYVAGVRDLGPRLALYPNRRLTQRSSPVTGLYYIPPGSSCVAPGRFLGDYITLRADGTTHTFAATWADDQPAPPWVLALRYSRFPLTSILAGTPWLVPVSASSAAPSPASRR